MMLGGLKMVEEHSGVSKPRASVGWLVNALLLAAVTGIFSLALKETGGELTLRTVLYGLLGVFGLVVNALLIVFWLRGSAQLPDSGWTQATGSSRELGEKIS
jgi:hypothetical protein